MKKYVLIVVLFLTSFFTFSYVLNNANGYFYVLEGSLGVIKEEASANLVIDVSETEVVTYGEKGKIKEVIATLPEYLKSHSDFDWITTISNVQQRSEDMINSKWGMKIAPSLDESKYQITLVIRYLYLGNYGEGFLRNPFKNEKGGAKFSGEMIIVERDTQNVKCHLMIDYIEGLSNYTANKRLIYTIGDVFFGRFVPIYSNKL